MDGSGSKLAVLAADDTVVGLQEGLTGDPVFVRGIEQEVQLPWLTKRYKIPLEKIIAEANDARLRNAGGGIGALVK